MILDLEGPSVRQGMSPRLAGILSVASAVVAAAALLVIAIRPHEPVVREVALTGPSVLAEAMTKPRPIRLKLELPSDVAAQIPPTRVEGVYGPARSTPTVRSYRLRTTNALIVVAMAPDAPQVFRPADAPRDALSVRGNYASSYMVEATSLSVVRWTENEMTYEISSRSLLARELARLGDLLR